MSLRQLFLTDNLLSDDAISSQKSVSHSSNKIARVLTKYVPWLKEQIPLLKLADANVQLWLPKMGSGFHSGLAHIAQLHSTVEQLDGWRHLLLVRHYPQSL